MQSPRWLNERPVSPNDLALLIHTGGMTDVPKGAALMHRNTLVSIAQSVAWVPVFHEDVKVFYCALLLFHALGFTIGLFARLRPGASVALFPKFDATMVLMSQKRLPCIFFPGTPPIYECLLETVGTVDVDLSSITFSLSGAMPLPGELTKRWEEATGNLIVEGYGVIEASPTVFGLPLSGSRRLGVLGIPSPSTRVRIVDPEGSGVGILKDEVGELIVKSPRVFSGCWERLEETAEVLWNGWLRTGDLVRVQDDSIHMANRRKEMVNASGFNMHPSQVEDAVRDMLDVRDIAVIGLPAGGAGENVVTAIVLEAGASIILTDMRQQAEKSITHYALPRQIVVMAELPRSQLSEVMCKKVREQILDTADSVLTTTGQVRNMADQICSVADQVRSAVDSAAASVAMKLRNLKNHE